MTFKGWKREVKEHAHNVTPVPQNGTYRSRRYTPKAVGGPLTWRDPLSALGKVNDLALTGTFLVEFTFEPQEIRNWLTEYVKGHPADALRLLAQAQAEAVIALNSSLGVTTNS